MKFIAALCLLPAVLGIQLTGTSFNKCEGHPGQINKVEFEPCTNEVCPVVPFKYYDIKATFVSTHDTASDCRLKGSVLVAGAWYELVDDAVCGTDLPCPLKKGQTTLLKKSIQVTDKMAVGQQLTRWKLLCNSLTDEIFCGEIKIDVQSK